MIFIIHYPKHYVQLWQISSFTSLFTSIQVHLSCWFTSFFHSFLQNIALRSHLPAAAYMSDHNTKPMAFLGFNSNSLFPWCILSSPRYYLWCKDWAMIHRHKNLRHRAFVLKKISASYKGLPIQGGEQCRHGDPLLQKYCEVNTWIQSGLHLQGLYGYKLAFQVMMLPVQFCVSSMLPYLAYMSIMQ
jgi:hypothetical protein